LFIALFLTAAGTLGHATENGISMYPVGAETVMPGVMPPSGKTIFAEFDNFYQANGLMDGSGHNSVPGFHLRVAAAAVKFVHNWGVKALGGELVSSAALPVLYEHLTGPFGTVHKAGLGNPDIGVLAVTYAKGPWHWWYGVDAYTPGAQYNKNDLLNVGQHNFSTAPLGAFTYLPDGGRTEISSRVQYIVNFTNPADQYRSGHELIWEYIAARNVTRKLSIGLNGYGYLQTTDDRQNGIAVASGYRGRVFAAGPQIKYHVGEVALILKYQKEMLVENRTKGNSMWIELGIPLWREN
jgi:hypothetical protein